MLDGLGRRAAAGKVIILRGEALHIEVADDTTSRVGLLKGRVEVFNPPGSVALRPGEQAIAPPGSAPVKSLLLKPGDAVQWIVPVPPLLTAAASRSGSI